MHRLQILDVASEEIHLFVVCINRGSRDASDALGKVVRGFGESNRQA